MGQDLGKGVFAQGFGTLLGVREARNPGHIINESTGQAYDLD